MTGRKLAHYQITDRIGAGGMGEVYRARDTRLGREVALKLLPEAFASDDERLARFRREAKLLAQLNHAHIATLHGLEEADGQHFLVMELVEGEDLAQRLARGAIPAPEALAIARDVADALQAAHMQGIVHRDLKPANIKVTPEGKVKVLDFGLAKALESDSPDKDMTTSPTIATDIGTMGGVILGTAAYMSPEQARGKPVDKLTDVWAMGCVLFEMLTARQAFPGETVSDTIARILEREPDWSALPADTPAPIHRLLRRCLQKDKTMRLQDVGEIRVEVDGSLSGASKAWTSDVVDAAPLVPPGVKRPTGWIALAVVAAVAALGMGLALLNRHAPDAPLMRSSITAPSGTRFNPSGDFAGPVVLSPDGTRLAFTALDAELKRHIYVRDLRELEPRMVPGTEDATFPFWSPDGRSIGFFSGTSLLRVELSGGMPITICPTANGRGGSWGADGRILFAPDFRSGIYSVPESGGTPRAVTKVDTLVHSTHRWPFALPDGEHFLYVAAHHDVSQSDQYGVYFASLDGGEPRRLVKSGAAAIYASGHLLYLRESTLTATPFDPSSGEFTGDPVAMIDKVEYDPTIWRAAFSASENGLLAYHGDDAGAGSATRLMLFDRAGNEVNVVENANAYYEMAMTRDGGRIALTARTNAGASLGLDVWLYEVERDLRTRLTFGDGTELSPTWSPDETRIAYSSIYVGASAATNSINVMMASGGGRSVLYEAQDDLWITDWTDDGRYILFSRGAFVGDRSHVWVLPLDGSDAFPLLQSDRLWEDAASVSPDGRWIVYTERSAGLGSVHVSPFAPDPSAGDPRNRGKWQVSVGTGATPRWNGDGTEIYYIQTNGRVWVAKVETSGELFQVTDVRVLFIADPWNFGRVGFDAAPSGDLFLVNSFAAGAAPPITLVQNWLAGLNRRD